jgi:hypothetical protein
MAKKQRALWKQVLRREFTAESIKKAQKSGDMNDLEEAKDVLSTCDSCEQFLVLPVEDRAFAYLEMASNMKNASPSTLKKLRKRLNLE